jgi:hypothetical protein
MNTPKQTRIYNPPRSDTMNNKQNKEKNRADDFFFKYINNIDSKELRYYNSNEDLPTWREFGSKLPGLRMFPWWDKADDVQETWETIEAKLKDYEPFEDNEFLKRHGWKVKTSLKTKWRSPQDSKAEIRFLRESDDVISYPAGLISKALYDGWNLLSFPFKPVVGTAEAKPAPSR